MAIDELIQLIENPREALNIELKNWIDPETDEGKSKIVKAVIAMRNNNGGYIVIGFDNETLQPDNENMLEDIKEKYHFDKIQAMVSKYCSQQFEVKVDFVERDSVDFPIITIPSGVETPVVTKSALVKGDNQFIKESKVYIRTLNANNTPSTTEATWKDWDRIVKTCFDNREADIGRFFRRHIVDITKQVFEINNENNADRIIEEGSLYYLEALDREEVDLPEYGFWEVGLAIHGITETEISANHEFLNLLYSHNPNYTGWPVWLDCRNFTDDSCKPYNLDGAWQALLLLERGIEIEFWRINPSGKFYLKRALEDDTRSGLEPKTILDYSLPIMRIAEAMGVAKSYAIAMGYNQEDTILDFAFRWTGLKGRELGSWSGVFRRVWPGKIAQQDELITRVQMPLYISYNAISEYVNKATKQLFEIFDGYKISIGEIEELTNNILQRGKSEQS